MPLSRAATELVTTFAAQAGIALELAQRRSDAERLAVVSLRLTGQLDKGMPADAGEDMLHALREALSNAARHGQATSVEVSIGADREFILLVRDNGTGITNTSRRSGLANLAQRALARG